MHMTSIKTIRPESCNNLFKGESKKHKARLYRRALSNIFVEVKLYSGLYPAMQARIYHIAYAFRLAVMCWLLCSPKVTYPFGAFLFS
jgi:hypothetical protein